MSTKFNEAGFEIIEDDDLIDFVARGMFTGIMYGGSNEEWLDEVHHITRDLYRCGAIDAIRAYREYERNNG